MNIQQIERQRKLFIVFNRSMSTLRNSDVDAKDKIEMRLKKAFRILQSKDYYNDPERLQYQPTKWSCGCPDYIYKLRVKRGYQGACCHMIAERLKDRMQEIKYQQLDFFNRCR